MPAGVFLATACALVLRNLFLLRAPIYETGDQAANSILVNQAAHFRLLVGNYSRLRFNHPGPAFLYVQAAGQQLLYSALHAVPARYNGQVLADVALNAGLLALAALVVGRRLRRGGLGGAFVLVCLAMTASQLRWADTWMPYLYAAPFLLAIVAGASVAAGALADLPLLVLSGGLLVHGHIAFVPIVCAYFLGIALAFLLRWRGRRTELATMLRQHRWPLAVSAGLASLFLLPIVLELALHWPGPWGQYWHYATSSHPHAHRPGAALGFVARYWTERWWSRALIGAAGAAAVGLVLTERDTDRRRYLAAVLGSCVLLSLLFVAYVLRGVDSLTLLDEYVGFFYFMVPAAVVATAAVAALGRAGDAVAAATGAARLLRPAPFALAAAGAALVIASSSFVSPTTGDPRLPQLASAIAAGRPPGAPVVAVELPSGPPLSAGWPEVTGLVVAASRQDYRVCVANAWWTFMMTTQYICDPGEERHALRLLVLPPGVPAPAGWSRDAVDGDTTILFK